MNKLLAMLFAFGEIGSFALSQQVSFETQSDNGYGVPAGPVRTVYITEGDKLRYTISGAMCLAVCLYFIARVRRDDSRR